VDENELKVGKAHISLKHLGAVQVLTDKQMLAKRTRDADPAAYLAIRFWTPRGIVIDIADTRDTTPYWLVTSKKGEKLARAIKG
jgi:extradiol dioxygenase family protein